MPVRLGIKRAIQLSAVCYGCSFVTMIITGFALSMKWPYWLAISLVGGIFIYHQGLAVSGRLGERYSRLFKTNMLISPLLLAGTAISLLV